MQEKLSTLCSVLNKDQPVLVQTHDFPDHDALGAAYALLKLLETYIESESKKAIFGIMDSVESNDNYISLIQLLNTYNLNFKLLKRKYAYIIYAKKIENICDFLKAIEVYQAYLNFEETNENVKMGKLIDESRYSFETKQIAIEETVNIDFIRNWKVVHEIKKSKAIEEAAIWQVKYYIYFLKKRGIEIEKGIIDYPEIRERKEILFHCNENLKSKNWVIIKLASCYERQT